jgi:hypothetical protein
MDMRSLIASALLLVSACGWGAAAEPGGDGRDLHFSASVFGNVRTLSGAIQHDVSGPNNFLATTDTLGLDSAVSVTAQAAARYKRWTFGINYSPVQFEGAGYGYDTIGTGPAAVLARVGIDTTVDVDLLLGNVLYDLIHEKNMTLAVGGGLGATAVDLSLAPRAGVGEGLQYHDTTPFGFFTVNMANRYRKFLYGVNLNAINFSVDNFALDYSDITVHLGYAVLTRPAVVNLVGGFRQVKFHLQARYTEAVTEPNFTLTGPFLGLNVPF